ncbi:MAG: O-antigen ligase family protein [Thermoleophilia bacterium]
MVHFQFVDTSVARHEPADSPFLRTARLCLHLLVVIVPLATSDLRWTGLWDAPFTADQHDLVKVFFMRALVLVAAGGWVWHAFTRGVRLRTTGVEWVLAAFLGWVFLATIFSAHVPTAVLGKIGRYEGLLSLAAYGLLFFLTVQLVTTAAHRRALAVTLFLTGVAVSVYGILQYLGFDVVERGPLPFEANQAFATMGNPNLLAGYLLFPLTIGPVIALSETRSDRRAAFWAGVLVVATAWLTTFTRGAWIGGAVGLAAVMIFAVRVRVGTRALDWGFGMAAGIAAAVMVARSVSSPSAVTNVIARARTLLEFRTGSGLTRLEIWQAALSSIRDSPIVGHGPDTFRLVFPLYKPAEYARDAGHASIADNAHNYPLQLASGTGIPGMLLFYGAVGWIMWRSLNAIRVRASSPDGLVLAGFWSACLAYLIHLLFGLSVVGSSTLLWLSLGVVLAPEAGRRLVRPVPGGALVTGVVVALLAVAFAGNAVMLTADAYAGRSFFAPEAERRLDAARTSISLNPWSYDYRSTLAGLHMDESTTGLDRLEAETQAGMDPTASMKIFEATYQQAVSAFTDALDFSPLEDDTYPNLATLYIRGAQVDPARYDDALALIRRRLSEAPFSPRLMLNAAVALSSTGRVDEAIGEAERAAELDPNYVEPRVLLGSLYAQTGDSAQARAFYEEALRLDPTQAIARAGLQALDAASTPQ